MLSRFAKHTLPNLAGLIVVLAACSSRTTIVAPSATPAAAQANPPPLPSSLDLPIARNALPLAGEPVTAVWVLGNKVYRDGEFDAEATHESEKAATIKVSK